MIARADQRDIDLHKASDRVNFGSIAEPIKVPSMLCVQTDSFQLLIGNERWQQRVAEDEAAGTNPVPHISGLDEDFQEISPIETFAPKTSLSDVRSGWRSKYTPGERTSCETMTRSVPPMMNVPCGVCSGKQDN